jgi:hypothetical protein
LVSCEQKTEKNMELENRMKKINEVNKLKKTVIVYDSIFDAGVIKKGEKVTATFSCKNVGDNPWQIAEISASCGCTNATKAPEKAIPIGGNFEIKASIDTKDFSSAKFEKTITVLSNCQEPVLILRIIGKLK